MPEIYARLESSGVTSMEEALIILGRVCRTLITREGGESEEV